MTARAEWIPTSDHAPDPPAKPVCYEFTEAEAAVAARLTRLVDAGLLPAAAAKVARSGGDVWLSPYVLVTVI